MFIYHFLLQDSNWKKEELMLKKVAENIREKSLDKEKIKTITPFDINEDLSLPYSQLMGKDIAALLECSAILLCKGWEKSKGCRLEKATADIYDLEVLFEE